MIICFVHLLTRAGQKSKSLKITFGTKYAGIGAQRVFQSEINSSQLKIGICFFRE